MGGHHVYMCVCVTGIDIASVLYFSNFIDSVEFVLHNVENINFNNKYICISINRYLSFTCLAERIKNTTHP